MSVLVGTTAGAFRVDGSNQNLISGTRVNHIVRDGSGWWAADGKGRIHHEGQHVATMPEGAAPLCIQPGGDIVWIGSTEARLFALEGDQLGLDEFFEEVPGREAWHTPWGAPADTRSMALDAERTLFINVHVGGIVRYDNTGPTPTVDINSDIHQVAAHQTQGGAIFAASAQGLAFARDGHDFDFRDDGLHAPYCRAVVVMDDMVVVSASTGPHGGRARVYRSSLWGGEFEPMTAGLPEWFDGNVDTHCLCVVDSSLFIGHGDTIWRSDDAGATWSVLTDGLPSITCLG